MLDAVPARLTRRAPTAIALAALVFPAGLLAGCGGDSTDGALPSPSASTSKAVTPAPGRSALPAPELPAAPKDTAKAREAFAGHILDAWSYALGTNQAHVVTGLSPKKTPCKGCDDFESDLSQRRKQGWYVDFPGAEARKIVVKTGSAGAPKTLVRQFLPKVYNARMTVDIPASRSYFDDGSFRNTNDAHSGATFNVLMAYAGGTYVLLGFQVV